MNEENKIKNQKKCQINKKCLYLLGFYLGVIDISDLALKYYLKAQKNINNSTFSKIKIIIQIAYLIKPLYGLLIDLIPIFGYKKKFYLIICFVINIISLCIIVFNYNNFVLSIICHFLINITISFTAVISSAIQVEISRFQDKQNGVSAGTKTLLHQYYKIKTIGNLILSFFKGFLIQKYSIDIIFYICGFLSFFIFISGIILDEDKYKKKEKGITRIQSIINFSPIIEKKDCPKNNKLDKFKNIVLLLVLIFILELTPLCDIPLFHYETNILGFTPQDLGLLDCLSQIFIIIFIEINNRYCYKFNFRTIIFVVRILIFFCFFLIYLLITKNTQKYINDFILIAFSSALRAGLNSLGKMPYRLLCFKYSPFGYGATIFAISDCVCNLGNLLAELIDYFCAFIYNVTYNNFINFEILVFTESILNLLPLIYIWIPESKFFSVKKEETSAQELSPIENKNNDDKNNNIDEEENKDRNIDINEIDNEKEKITKNVLEKYVYNGDEDMCIYYNYDDISIGIYNSFSYLITN